MADKISGYGRTGLDVSQARSRGVSRANVAESGSGERAEKGRDAVEVSDTATRLKAIEARLAKMPDVDRGRVDAVRQRIESGEYRPDASRIAEKLIRFERQFA